MNRRRFVRESSALLILSSAITHSASAAEGWIDLIGGEARGLDAFKNPKGYWKPTTEVAIDPKDPRKLAWKESSADTGIWVNGPTGKTNNLVTQATFGDLEVMLDFVVPKGSNSGIKLQGLYEIQIYDSFGVSPEKFDASGLGGVYPRAELLPRYHHIDKGYPAKVNASRPPGEWQSMHIVFRAPKFDNKGKKTAPARFDKVVINGQVAHENLTIPTPTGHAYVLPEVARGPILLQGDHGPVAFRNVKVRPIDAANVS
jgi:hypothetical protein